MCNAFSAVITEAGDIYWQAGLDSHEDIIDKFKLNKLDKKPGGLHRIEITPENMDYLNPDGRWDFKHDEDPPKWWNNKYRDLCFIEFAKWKNKVYSLINLEEARNPVNPFDIEPPKKITDEHIYLVRQWDSVWNSVWNSIWDSVGDSVGVSIRDSVWDSVWNSVRDSIRDSVWNSVRNSVWDYVGSLFKLPEWQKSYPYRVAVDLWKMGLVASFDGEVWRLHGGKKAKILWEGKLE